MNNSYIRLKAMFYNNVNGYNSPQNESVPFKKDHVCVVHNHIYLNVRLTKDHRLIFDYLCEMMDKDQKVHSTIETLKSFHEHLMPYGVTINIGTRAFREAISRLVKLNLLISMSTKGVYIVNPKYVYRGSLERRKTVLRWLLKKINDRGWQNSNVFSLLGKFSGYRPHFGKTKK